MADISGGLCNPLTDAFQCGLSDGGSGGRPGGSGGGGNGSGLGFHVTLGVRAPGQTYTQCLTANSQNYSIAGVGGIVTGASWGTTNFLLGNDISQILFGDRGDGFSGLSIFEGGSRSFEAGVGTVTTFGRRTATVTAMNLKGITGPAPRILAKTGAEEIAEWVTGIAEFKLAADVGFTAAEAVGCIGHQ